MNQADKARAMLDALRTTANECMDRNEWQQAAALYTVMGLVPVWALARLYEHTTSK